MISFWESSKCLFTEQQLLQILPNARPVAGIFLPALNRAMARWKIDSRIRQSAFLAQVGHESGQLRNLVENLNYSAEALVRIWPSRFTSQTAPGYARQPEKIANKVYGGRMGNGPGASGDGWRYRGRGLLQVTGRNNYREAGAGLGLPLESEPQLLEQPEHAAQSAAWCWWLIALALVGGGQQYRVVVAHGETIQAQADLSADRLQVAERDRRATTQARTEEQRRQAVADEEGESARQKLELAQGRAAAAESAAGGMRGEIARLRDGLRATCDTSAAQQRQARTSAVVVFGGLLEDADRMAGSCAAALERSRIAGLACEAVVDGVHRGSE